MLGQRRSFIFSASAASASAAASRAIRTALFPKDDPSLRDTTPESVAGLTRDDVLAYYNQVLRPDMTTIVVIGRVTPERARYSREHGGLIDQADLARILGRLSSEQVEDVIRTVQRHYHDPSAADDLRQYHEIGKWEYQTDTTTQPDSTNGPR